MAQEIDLSLPEFVWLSGGEHEEGGDSLIDREIIMHTPSAAIVEILMGHNYLVPDGKVVFKFVDKLFDDTPLNYTAMLHNYEINDIDDVSLLQKQILKPVVKWYCNYWKRMAEKR